MDVHLNLVGTICRYWYEETDRLEMPEITGFIR